MSLDGTRPANRHRQAIAAGQALFAPAEADVMRLVAVLSLCLMLLFAAEQHFAPHDENIDRQAPVVVADTHDASDEPAQTSENTLIEASSDAQARESDAAAVDRDDSADSGPRELMFDSDAALLQLLLREQVALYLLREDRWWQITLGGERPSEGPSGHVYAMRHDTVPAVLRNRAQGVRPSDNARWAVQLSPGIQAQIDASLQAGDLASLVIEGSGEIRRRGNGAVKP
ncbi:MAG: hypothetical protein JJT93_16275 [Gammaproteobacteria bacterium]|nr:hypothetical protein [Gammaproteobacteria bacterium]